MKICIFGAGAIGGFLGHALAQVSSVELSLVARGEHLEAIRTNGLSLELDGLRTTVRPKATSNPAELGPQDYVIIGLKAYQAWQAAEMMVPLLGENTAVVTCQNGVPWWYFHSLRGPFEGTRLETVDPRGSQWEAIGPERAIGCVVYPATEIQEPGVIRHVYGDKFPLGEPDGTISERCLRLSRAIEEGGLRAPVLEDIRSEIWLKLWGNLCFNPISALTRATLDVVATDPCTRPIVDAMMREVEPIANKLGSTFRVDRGRRINGAARVGPHRTSMLQDLERGRDMEIDALVAAVQELALITEVPTPTLDVVLGLVTQLGTTLGLHSRQYESISLENAPQSPHRAHEAA